MSKANVLFAAARVYLMAGDLNDAGALSSRTLQTTGGHAAIVR